jgi:D-beta-D-heptose 7-phosphate kinase/D-beta-D-heptose 1-phosphate adenosyltransferase
VTRVVVNGSFDILHLGHLQLLEHAKSYPNSYVLVLTDSDKRIKSLKGNNRPINSEYERTKFLSSLKFVDRVELFNSDSELETLIKDFNPDIMVKGSDYKDKKIIGAEYCKTIYFYERYKDYSTTKKIQDITNRR